MPRSLMFLRQICMIICVSVFWLNQSYSAEEGDAIFRRGNIGEPDSLDPHLTTSGYAFNIIFEMFVGLTTLTQEAEVVAGAAASWTISENGKVYIFKMRNGMLWSDGKPVLAEDFAYSFRRMMDPVTASRGAPMFYMIKNARKVNSGQLSVDQLGVTALDENTLRIELDNPTPFFLELIAHRCLPVRKDIIEEFGQKWTRPENIVVNGAFKLEEWKPQTSVKVVKNELFYDVENVKLDGVVYFTTENLAAAFNRYRAGDLDMIVGFPMSQLDYIKAKLPQHLRISQNLGLEYITFNTSRAPFDDYRVRSALSMTIERDILTAKIMKGSEKPAYSLIPEGSRDGYQPAFASYRGVSRKDRIQKAKVLLQEAGFTYNNPLKFTYRYNSNEVHQRVAAALSEMWKQSLGVEVALLNSDLNVLNSDLRSGNYEVARYQWFAEHRDPSTFLYLLESTSIGDNHSKFSNRQFDDLMQKSYKSVELGTRKKIMAAAERLAMRELPITPINFYVSKRLVRPHVKGLVDNIRGINLSRYLYID
jgi:oligopeptide transport system substrate-binding protein